MLINLLIPKLILKAISLYYQELKKLMKKNLSLTKNLTLFSSPAAMMKNEPISVLLDVKILKFSVNSKLKVINVLVWHSYDVCVMFCNRLWQPV